MDHSLHLEDTNQCISVCAFEIEVISIVNLNRISTVEIRQKSAIGCCRDTTSFSVQAMSQL